MKITTCKSCGAKITWIKTKNGRVMPCNVPAVNYQDNIKGSDLIITEDGQVIRGTIVKDNPESKLQMIIDGQGYTSHFATCPDAAQYRGGVNEVSTKPKL